MLEHLGHPQAAADVMAAVEACLTAPTTRTRDLAGTAGTEEVAAALLALLARLR